MHASLKFQGRIFFGQKEKNPSAGENSRFIERPLTRIIHKLNYKHSSLSIYYIEAQ